MALSIEMTVRGVLLAGHWRTAEELDEISTANKRNTLIVELANTCTNQPVPYFQRLDDDRLIGKAAVWILLSDVGAKAGPNTPLETDDKQRNFLIGWLNSRTDTPVPTLQGQTDAQLVIQALDWINKSRTVTGILEFNWILDSADVVSTTPEVIFEATYPNPSDIEMPDKFSFKRTISSSSEFSHDHSFEFTIGVSTEFEAGIPFFATNTTTVDVTTGTKNTWKFGETNETTQEYEHTIDITIPPRTTIKRSASVTRGRLNVPYRARIRTAAGTERVMSGIWSGVSTWNLVSKQEVLETSSREPEKEVIDSLPDVEPAAVS